MQLLIANNSASNPLSMDLTHFIDVQDGDGMDPANPAFTSKVIAHSLLKPGGFLALEDLQAKEMVFPLDVNSTTQSLMINLIVEINQIINTPGATASWQDDGLSQPTIFDLYSGQFDVTYSYRRSGAKRTKGNLRLFTAPLGRSTTLRTYAAASGMGPVMLITPYASSGAVAITGGSGGFAGAPQGASTGIFYTGAPSLAGDAPAELIVSYVMNSAAGGGPSYTAFSQLPDGNYHPAMTIQSSPASYTASTFGGKVYHTNSGAAGTLTAAVAPVVPTLQWAGDHRVLALARASVSTGTLTLVANSLVADPINVSVAPGTAWSLYDLGTYSLRPSISPAEVLTITMAPGSTNSSVDVTGLISLPDAKTWFCRGTGVAQQNQPNNIVIDEYRGDQFLWTTGVSNPISIAQVLSNAGVRITQYSRGIIPAPDPKDGLPIFAILGIGGSVGFPFPLMQAQVDVIERTRYVLP